MNEGIFTALDAVQEAADVERIGSATFFTAQPRILKETMGPLAPIG